MGKQNFLFGMAALLLLILAGGGTAAAVRKARQGETETLTSESITETISSDESETIPVTEPLTEPETQAIDAPSYPSVSLDIPPVDLQDALLTVEAENAEYTGGLYLDTVRSEYSGEGYISGFSKSESDSIRAAFMIPSAQHYDITISVCAESPVKNTLLVNGDRIHDFTITETQHFVRVTFSGIYLPAGEVDLSFEQIDGNFSVDYFEIANHTELSKIKYQNHDTLSDPQASTNAKKLMTYLSECYGKAIITGQHVSDHKNTELDEIYKITGKYPAIRFSDLQGNADDRKEDITACQLWARHGGIVGLSWSWEAPENTGIYEDETNFSLSDAIPASDASGTETALLTDQQINAALADHTISASCAAILRDIDQISEALKPLADQDIPVLWRPLPEAGGKWFWWGADGAQAYRWLWNVIYHRMTEYHQLHNLIWIWNGQSKDYLVNQYDIASMDIYLDPQESFDSRYEQFLSLYRMTKHKKILALSECSTVPDMNLVFRDHTIWSFMGLWHSDYLKEPYTSEELLINFYNSEKSLTLENSKAEFAKETAP